MASRIMQLAIEIKGKLDGSVPSTMQRAISESKQLQSQIKQANQAMRDAQRAADAEQRSTGRVSTAQYQRIAELQARINALTQRRSDILDAQAAKEQARSRLSSSAGKLGTGLAVTAAAAAPLAAMIGTAANFEQAMSKVKAITNATDGDFQKLSATAQELGSKTQFSASQAAEAMTYLGMAGWKTEQIISGMPGLLDLAAASGSSLATVADIVSDDLTAFGMSAEQAGHMADVMAAASTNANTNVEMMGQTFKYAGSVAGSLGYSLEDVAVATGLMANAGIKADQAGTSLRAIMTRMVAPTKQSGTAMDQLGITVTNADGTMKPFMQTMEELRDKFSGLSDAEKATYGSMIAGKEAMSGFLAIVNASDKDFENLCNAVDNADGAAARMAKTMNDNAKGGAIQLQSAIEGVSIAVGQIFLPTLANMARAVADQVGSIAKWAQENQGLVTTLITAAGAVTGLILAVLTINTAVAAVNYLCASMKLYKTAVAESTIATKLWAGATKVAAAAQAAFNAIMAANPIALAVLAVVALIGVLTYLFKKNQAFHDAVVAAWEGIKAVATRVWTAIVSAVSAAISTIMSVVNRLIPIFTAVWNVIKTIAKVAFIAISIAVLPILAGIAAAMIAVGSVIYITWLAVKAVALAVWGAIGPYVMEVLESIKGFVLAAADVIMAAWEAIKAYANAAWDFISALVGSVAEAIGSFITAAAAIVASCWDTIYNAAVSCWNSIVSTVQSVWSQVQGIIDNGVAAVTDKWDKLKAIFSSPIQAVVNFVRGGDSSAASASGVDISANAQGGIYRRGAFLTTFAEDSAEAAIPLDGSARALSLWRQAGQMLGAMPSASAAPVAAARGNSSADNITIDFNPTINIQGGADAGMMGMIRAALAEQKAQFEKELPMMLERVKTNQRRLSYE